MSSRGKKLTQAILKERQARAVERQKQYDALSIEEKLAKLPPEPQAQRQRSKLMAQLEKKNKKSIKTEQVEQSTEQQQSKLKAKDRKSKESRGE